MRIPKNITEQTRAALRRQLAAGGEIDKWEVKPAVIALLRDPDLLESVLDATAEQVINAQIRTSSTAEEGGQQGLFDLEEIVALGDRQIALVGDLTIDGIRRRKAVLTRNIIGQQESYGRDWRNLDEAEQWLGANSPSGSIRDFQAVRAAI